MMPMNSMMEWMNGMNRALKARLDQNPRRGAIGKALIVYLFSGSIVLAVIAFIIFKAIGH